MCYFAGACSGGGGRCRGGFFLMLAKATHRRAMRAVAGPPPCTWPKAGDGFVIFALGRQRQAEHHRRFGGVRDAALADGRLAAASASGYMP